MHAFRFSSAESRVTRYSVDDINKVRSAAGAAPIVAPKPVQTFTSTAAKGSTDFYKSIPSHVSATDAAVARQDATKQSTATAVTDPAAAAAERYKQTADYVSQNPSGFEKVVPEYDAAGNIIGTKVVSSAEDTLAQAKEGQAAASGYVAPTPRAGNTEFAADAAKRAGQTVAPVAGAMGQPGATGFGGSIQSVQQAQGILLTSRSATEKAEAQKFIDDHIGGIKGYAPKENVDEFGNKFTTYSVDDGATKNAQQAERDRLAKESQTMLQASKMKQDQANNLPVTKVGGETGAEIDSTMQLLKGLQSLQLTNPELANAFMPAIQARINAAAKLKTQADGLANYDVNSDPLVVSAKIQANTRESQLTQRLAEDKRILNENKDISLEANKLATDMLLADKATTEMKNREDEMKQAKLNVEGERQLRRSLNEAGVETSPLAIEYLTGKIQEAADHLATMRQVNGQGILKYDIVHKQLANDVRSILNTFDEKRALLNNTFTDNISNVDSFVTQAKTTALADAKKKLKELSEGEDKLMTEAADKIAEAGLKAAELAAQAGKEARKDMMTTKDKLGFTSNLRGEINSNKVISQANDADGFYGAMQAGYDEYRRIVNDPKADKESLNAAQTAMIGSFARILDPGSVVRNEEYERQVYGQSLINTANGLWDKVKRGGTGLTEADIESMKATADKLHTSWEKRLGDNMQKYILSIDEWNKAYPDTPVNYGEVLDVSRVHLPEAVQKKWESDAYGATGNLTGTESADFGPTPNPPANGFRTDRNNNPTALQWTPGVEKWFTDNGYAVSHNPDDPWPNNKNAFTLDMTKVDDPVAATIAYIDAYTFHTSSKSGNKPRWTHTDIPKEEWDQFTMNQKRNIVLQMAHREGTAKFLPGASAIAEAPKATGANSGMGSTLLPRSA